VFWVVALGVGAALGFFLSHRVGWGVEQARAGPLDTRAAAEGHRERAVNHTRAPRPFVSRPKGPQTEAICADPPLLSNAGLVLPKCVAANNLLDELLDQVVLPFWLGPDGLGVDCDKGGFANLGLTPDTEGAGESWKLGERFLMPHARTAAAFAKLHASGAFADATDGGDAKDEMPWYYVNGESHPKCLSNGGALALARHALRFATESMRDEENGGYYWSVVASEPLGGKFVPSKSEKRLDALAAVLMASSEIVLAAENNSDAETEAAETADDAFFLMMDESKHRDDAARGGYWPEILDEDWSLVAGVGIRGNPRTLAAHLLAMEALGKYVDSLVKRNAGDERVARAAAALAADVRTLADKALLTEEAEEAEERRRRRRRR
jgi:mannose/cellobiose epimerase-like protein (N-acyl-D-glucosamine 2-epimerase family)